MNLETLRMLRNILLRCVVVGVGFAIALAAVVFIGWDSWIGWATKLCHTDEAHLSSVMLTLFTEIRFFLVFLLLTPAIAIHWTIKSESARSEKAKAVKAIEKPLTA